MFGSEIAWTLIDSGYLDPETETRKLQKFNLTKFNFVQFNVSPLVFVMHRKILTSVLKVKYTALFKIEKNYVFKREGRKAKIKL